MTLISVHLSNVTSHHKMTNRHSVGITFVQPYNCDFLVHWRILYLCNLVTCKMFKILKIQQKLQKKKLNEDTSCNCTCSPKVSICIFMSNFVLPSNPKYVRQYVKSFLTNTVLRNIIFQMDVCIF